MCREFDAIAIGSGLGGLTAAALYARAGYRVLVLERNQHYGGAATIYRHGALAIEVSLHEIDGLDAEDPKGSIMRALGLDDRRGKPASSGKCLQTHFWQNEPKFYFRLILL
jgi:choline dehydrogenase-like flavoprotein